MSFGFLPLLDDPELKAMCVLHSKRRFLGSHAAFIWRFAFPFCVIPYIAGCPSSHPLGSDESPDSVIVRETVGPDGGHLVATNGLVIDIEADALTTSTSVTVREYSNSRIPTTAREVLASVGQAPLLAFELEIGAAVLRTATHLTVPVRDFVLPGQGLVVTVSYYRETIPRFFPFVRRGASPRGIFRFGANPERRLGNSRSRSRNRGIFRFGANPERARRETGDASAMDNPRPPFGLGP